MSTISLWLLILAAGAGTLLLRLSFLGLPGRDVPPLVRRMLRLVPAAVLAALVAPGVLPGHDPGLWTGHDLAKVGAATVAAVVARASGNMVLTLLAGMAALWLSGLVT